MDPSKRKLHALSLPAMVHSHIGGMLKLAKLLHHRGFCITFVNTESIHSPVGFPVRGFVPIPDGIPPLDSKLNQDLKAKCNTAIHKLIAPLCSLIEDLNNRSASGPGIPPISCILADGFMSLPACPASEKFGIPVVHLYTISDCSLMGFMQFSKLVEEGYIPLKGKVWTLLPIIFCQAESDS